MRYVEITAGPDPDRMPALFRLLACPPMVQETRLLDWTMAPGGAWTALWEMDGDVAGLREALGSVAGVRWAEVTELAERRALVLASVEPAGIPLLQAVTKNLLREGAVVAMPIVYRDGRVHARAVGRTGVLQELVANAPPDVSIEVTRTGTFERTHEGPLAALTDRQREAVLAAHDLGYYEVPRRATHRDVARRLGCSPATAGEHLQRAERRLVERAVRRGLHG